MSSVKIIINSASGTGDKEEARQILSNIFSENGVDAHISLARSGNEISALARQFIKDDCQTIVAGGGDGTISSVASELVETEKKLGVLPLGTLNHFAKDLQIPLDLKAAARTIIAGYTASIDIGEVNGKIFINNSSLGFYPDVVRGREKQQRLGHGKWISLLRSAFQVLHRHLFLDVRLSANGNEIFARTPFVFVGNNEYEMESFNIGGRDCLDSGHLSLYMAKRSGRLALLALPFRALFGTLRQAKDFVSLCTDEVWVETRRKQLRVAMDGEVLIMQSPLHYHVRPGALRVIVPAPENVEASEKEPV